MDKKNPRFSNLSYFFHRKCKRGQKKSYLQNLAHFCKTEKGYAHAIINHDIKFMYAHIFDSQAFIAFAKFQYIS